MKEIFISASSLNKFIKTKYNYYFVRHLVVVTEAWTAGMSLDRKLTTTKNQSFRSFIILFKVLTRKPTNVLKIIHEESTQVKEGNFQGILYKTIFDKKKSK